MVVNMKNIYDAIFIVLVYKNYDDLKDFIISLKSTDYSYKVIVIDAFVSDDISNCIEAVSREYNCDYIRIENKGYSYGNNIGIKYALEKYNFRFIIISNPDIQVTKFDPNRLGDNSAIYGPRIVAKNGKMQNPFRVRYSRIGEWLTYIGYKYDIKIFVLIYVVINKLERELFLLLTKICNVSKMRRVYSLHGSFLIISRNVLNKDKQLFDNNMFLYAEEDYLAYKMKKNSIYMYYCDFFVVQHKENGSFTLSDNNLWSNTRKSILYYYSIKDND